MFKQVMVFTLLLFNNDLNAHAFLLNKESSGINLSILDNSIRPQDNFYQYANGLWLKNAKIPGSQSSWGVYDILSNNILTNLQTIIEELNKNHNLPPISNNYKLHTLYQSFINESAINKAGVKPLNNLFNEIKQIDSYNDLTKIFAKFNIFGINTPIEIEIHQDEQDLTQMVVELHPNGINLPEPEYYLKTNDKNLMLINAKYQEYIANLLVLANINAPKRKAKIILDLETQLAKFQSDKVNKQCLQNLDHEFLIHDLSKLADNIHWNDYFQVANIATKVDPIIITEPDYFISLNKLIKSTPLSHWQAYLYYQVLNTLAPNLSSKFSNLHFKFYDTILNGIPIESPRHKRAIYLVEEHMGSALGRLYISYYFPPENKTKISTLIHNLITAYGLSIESLTWLSSKAKLKMLERLRTMKFKIAYQDKWQDYDQLVIKPNDLIGNILRANQFNYNYEVNKLDHSINKSEWYMPPQAVNAYYNSDLNEIVIPAGILQPPFFNPQADMAANYGGIGAIIGHEITHAFDEQEVEEWLRPKDYKKFNAKTKALVKQYDKYSPLSGYHVNGKLTLSENIADNSGLSIAYQAYLLALHGESAPIINNLTGSERFYLSWAQVWRTKIRPKTLILLLKTGSHAPDAIRANAALRNQVGFYKTFNLKPKDKMYLAPNKRVVIW